MTTLLEFICEDLLGPPDRSNGDGESFWECPRCGSPKFHTLPVMKGKKDRVNCYSCQFLGDVYDFLKVMHPGEFFADRKERVAAFAKKFQEGREKVARDGRGAAEHLPPRGQTRSVGGDPYQRNFRDDEFSPEAWEAGDRLVKSLGFDPNDRPHCPELLSVLLVCEEVLHLCAAYGLHPKGLAGNLWFRVYSDKQELDHLAECDSSECDWAVCVSRRVAAGLHKTEIRLLKDVMAAIKEDEDWVSVPTLFKRVSKKWPGLRELKFRSRLRKLGLRARPKAWRGRRYHNDPYPASGGPGGYKVDFLEAACRTCGIGEGD